MAEAARGSRRAHESHRLVREGAMTDRECWGCRCVKENGPLSKVYGPPECIPCAARSLATVYGGKQRDQTEPEMRKLWPNQSDYIAGRLSFHLWARAIEEAKERNET